MRHAGPGRLAGRPTHAPRGSPAPAPHRGGHPARGAVRPRPERDALLACLDGPVDAGVVAARLGSSPEGAGRVLHRLAASGLLVRLGGGAFALPGHDPRAGGGSGRAVRAARGDGGASSSEEAPCNP